MQSYLSQKPSSDTHALKVLRKRDFAAWRKKAVQAESQWMQANGFEGAVGSHIILPSANGGIAQVVAVVKDEPDIWSIAHLATALPKGEYTLEEDFDAAALHDMALGWQLATYRFTRFKESKKTFATLILSKSVDITSVMDMAEGICLARELINRPANDLTPYALADAAKELAKKHKAECSVIKGDDLLKENYPLVHAVGRASDNAPCLIDMRWGKADAPKVTLVGKGICFDSGGLDIKPSSGMLLMKKDMGGAANVLALAHAIMAAKLPVRLRVMIPAAENSISANAFRPKDIIKSRKGITVEIGNTDAEGRLVLCDALAEADTEKPDLLIDFATLTGAARVALGTDIPACFTSDDALAEAVLKQSVAAHDPLWRMPLWEGYREMLDTDAADINNASESGYGGAITAALYLKEFVTQTTGWMHIDLMAWNTKNRPGRPQGGEAMGIRAVFAMLQQRYAAAR